MMWAILVPLTLSGQTLDSSALEGGYHYKYLRVSQPSAGAAIHASESSGTMMFDGRGSNYSVDERGVVSLASPGESPLALSARFSPEAGVLAGSAAGDTGVYDLFLAVKAATAPITPSGTYQAAVILFPNSQAAAVRSAITAFQAGEAGIQTGADGRGTMTLPLTTPLPTRSYDIVISADGGIIIGSPRTGSKGMLIAVRQSEASPSGLYWTAALAVEGARVNAGIGSLRIDGRGGQLIQRWNAAGGAREYRGLRDAAPLAVGAGGLVLLAAQTGPAPPALTVALRAPRVTGPGVFVDPHGIAGPVAPGALVALTGSNLAPRAAAANSVPLPQTLEGVSVSVNSQPAAIHSVSPTQIQLVLPADLDGERARIVVRNGNGVSRPVTVRVAKANPQAFLATHLDYTAITADSPARPGEPIVVFATGLGVRQPYLRVRVAGRPAAVSYSGPAGVPGLDQINLRIPAGTAGGAVPVSIAGDGHFTDLAEIAVLP